MAILFIYAAKIETRRGKFFDLCQKITRVF